MDGAYHREALIAEIASRLPAGALPTPHRVAEVVTYPTFLPAVEAATTEEADFRSTQEQI